MSFSNLTALTNGGTVTDGSWWRRTRCSRVRPVRGPSDLPCGAYFLDLNNDDKRDLVVSPNGTSLCQNFESLWFYLNEGTDDAPVFAHQQKDLFQADMTRSGKEPSRSIRP